MGIRWPNISAYGKEHHTVFKYYNHRAKRNKYQEFIRTVPILQGLDEYELYSIMDAAIPVEFKAEDTIITEVLPLYNV